MFYSHQSFCLSYHKLLGNEDKFYDAHESQYNFPVRPSIFIGRIIKTKYRILSLVGPKLGLILTNVGTIRAADSRPCGLGLGFEAAPFPYLPPVQAETTSANLHLGLIRSDHI